MGTQSKIINFDAFHKAKSFSPASPDEQKIISPETWEKIGEAPENNGLQGPAPAHPEGNSGESLLSPKKKMKAMKSQHAKPQKVTPSAGPEGHLQDCKTMTATELRLAYPGEYTSWRLRKSSCKKKGWPWDPAWNAFKDFLRDIGPKPDPADTLDRKDNDKQAYGPGLCRWASKTVQNNNKGNNVKIPIPVTGEVWTAPQLAKLHSVSPKTIYKWISQFYSPLEMLAGKKAPQLAKLWVALEELPKSKPVTKAKPPAQQIKMPSSPTLPKEWDPNPEDEDHYHNTGEMRDSRYEERLAEYQAVAKWAERYNLGLPNSPEPPQGKYYKIPSKYYETPNAANSKASLKASVPVPAKPDCVLHDETGLPDDKDNFDPADCSPPDYEGE